MRRFIIICLALTFITGCLPWVRTGGPFQAPNLNISVDLPDGWMRRGDTRYSLLVTRDGLYLQYILVEPINVDAELTHTKKKFRRGMMASELAQVIIDNTSSNKNVRNLKVRYNKPATINGHKGFKLIFTYKDTDGLKYRSHYYGFIKGDWFYGIRYNATERHYFKRDYGKFKKVLKSFELLS